MSATGLLARTTNATPLEFAKKRVSHDTIRSLVATTARGDVGIVTSFGRVIRQSVVGLPALADGAALSVAGGAALKEFLTLNKGETPLALMALDKPDSSLFLTTAFGTVKRVVNDVPASASDWNVIRLDEGDYLVGAIQCEDESGEVVLITSDAQLLHFDAALVRATGRPAGGVVGIRLYEGAEVIFGSVVDAHEECLVATVGGEAGALPGTAAHTMKLTPLTEFPGKGRATSGVRCHKFLASEDILLAAAVGNGPIHACGSTGAAVEVPDKLGKRDSSGTKLRKPVAAVCANPELP
jgi:DNA gyrase subunit A